MIHAVLESVYTQNYSESFYLESQGSGRSTLAIPRSGCRGIHKISSTCAYKYFLGNDCGVHHFVL